jgi:outer membrane immunogenic protein
MKKFVVVGLSLGALIAPAAAANLPLKAPPPPPEPVFSWAGWYVGGNLGWKHIESSMTSAPNDAPTIDFLFVAPLACFKAGPCRLNYGSSSGNGVVGGGQVGYNWQAQNWLVGIETDIQGSYAHATTNIATFAPRFLPFSGVSETQENWLGTVRGRLGVLVSPSILAYGTGGFAYGSIDRNWSGNRQGSNTGNLAAIQSWSGTTKSTTLTGWTAGGGLEWGLGYGFTLGAEYLYVRLTGGDTFLTNVQGAACAPPQAPANRCTFSVSGADVVDNIVRAKLNYKF